MSGREVRLECAAGYGYARSLLRDMGARVASSQREGRAERLPDPQLAWAQSGAMWLTGRADGPPLCCPVPIADIARGVMLALSALAPGVRLPDAARLLAERAAIAGLRRQGAVSAGGACQLLPTLDGVLAVNLPREDDWQLLPAWLGGGTYGDWNAVAEELFRRRCGDLLETAGLLGLAVAPMTEAADDATSWYRVSHTGRPRMPFRSPRVLDLSALWAGPLCGHLFTLLGAEVIKVESRRRPDGARAGPPAFFDLMNTGKASVAVDLDTAEGREQLRRLFLSADIVIESSRPRALQHLGFRAEELLNDRPGLTWISITGYGREQGHRIAYGDDAGVAGGLSAALWRSAGERVFCADAIADPLTGLHAALAGWASWLGGGGRLLDVALGPVVRHCARQPSANLLPVEPVSGAEDDWQVIHPDGVFPVARPIARVAGVPARALGADNAALLRRSGLAC